MNKILWVMAALFFTSVGCGKQIEPPAKEAVRSVKVIELTEQSPLKVRTYAGKVDAGETAMLAFQHAGKVVELPVVAGQYVKKGDLLAKIDPREFEQAVVEAKAKYMEAQKNADRFTILHEKNAISTAEFEQKTKDADVLKAQLSNAEKALQDTVLVAPIDGIISQRAIEKFQNVNAGDVALRIQNVRTLKISIDIPESDIATAARSSGDASVAVAIFDAAPGKEFPLQAAEWETQADAATQTFRVKFAMAQPSEVNILPGMTAQVRMQFPARETSENRPVFSVPGNVVFSDETGKTCVWVIDPVLLTAHKREITVGQVTGKDKIQVLAGIKPGDLIAITGIRQLREGVKVAVEKQDFKG